MLVIENVELDDEGFYNCIVVNKVGEVFSKVEIFVDEFIIKLYEIEEEIIFLKKVVVESDNFGEGLFVLLIEDIFFEIIKEF